MKTKLNYALLMTSLSLGLAANITHAESTKKAPIVKVSAEHAHKTIHWGYDGAGSPKAWPTLKTEYVLCGSGQRQSPVDVYSSKFANLFPVQFNYRDVVLQPLNNGHTLQANYTDTVTTKNSVIIGGTSYPIASNTKKYSSSLMLGDVPYELLQFHYHAPSEHALNGRHYAMEVDLVHRNADGNIAIVGVFLKKGTHNKVLQNVLDNVSVTINQPRIIQELLINATDLLPNKRDYFYYNGSLTTPPCTENVNWMVMKNPIEVSEKQVAHFIKLIGNNARSLQPLNWREPLGSL